MKLLISITLWLAAILLAGFVLWRLIRRKPMLLHGRLGRRAIRLAAVALVGLGLGGCGAEQPEHTASENEASDPTPEVDPGNRNPTTSEPDAAALLPEPEGEAPEPFVPPAELESLAQQAHTLLSQRRVIAWEEAIQGWYRSDRNTNLLLVILHLRQERQDPRLSEAELTPLSARIIADAAVEMRANSAIFDEPNCIMLWHALQQLPAPATDDEADAYVEAMAALRTNARMLNTLVRARFQVGLTLQYESSGWASKAGPRLEIPRRDVQAFIQATLESYPTATLGLWETEGAILFSIDKQSATVERLQLPDTRPLRPGYQYRMGRMDLLRTGEHGGRLVLGWLGTIDLPPNQTLRVSDLPALLSDDARARIDQALQQVRAGDDAPLLLIERHMPLCLPQLRAVLDELADDVSHESQAAKSALRFLVYLYDPLLIPGQTWAGFETQIRFSRDGAVWLYDDQLDVVTDFPDRRDIGPGASETEPGSSDPGRAHPGGIGAPGSLGPGLAEPDQPRPGGRGGRQPQRPGGGR